ncbi:MAG: PCRF domain-containing protein, partial [Sphaerochaetaceae bacterium]
MIDILEPFKEQLKNIDEKLADPSVMNDINVYKELMRERSHLEPIVEAYNTLKDLEGQIEDAELMLKEEDDADLIAMAKEEIQQLREQKESLEESSKVLLIPPDPLEGKNIIMEIRAGTGGDEAALF